MNNEESFIEYLRTNDIQVDYGPSTNGGTVFKGLYHTTISPQTLAPEPTLEERVEYLESQVMTLTKALGFFLNFVPKEDK